MKTLDPAQHADHHVDIRETSATYWHFNTDVEAKVLHLFDYTSGDGDGDYVAECYDCNESGPVPDEWELDWI